MIILKSFIWLVFIIGIVVFIHEFGHFLAAKLLKIKVEEFAFGFGKKIFAKKWKGTLYRINMLPFGGYVKLFGEEKESSVPGSFSSKSLLAKMAVVLAGVVMNFILAVVVFHIFLAAKDFEITYPRVSDFRFYGANVEIQNKPIVESIIENTPAQKVDFPTDSIIWSLDDVEVVNAADITNYLQDHVGSEVKIKVVLSDGKYQTVTVVPEQTGKEGVLLGVQFSDVVASFYKLNYQNNKIFSGLLHSINFTRYNLEVLGLLIGLSFKEKTVKPVAEGTVGFVGIASIIVDLVKIGDTSELFSLIATINLSLAIINILPIPGLDGGYILFWIVEKIRGRKVAERYQEWAMRIGFILLIVLSILITIKDIVQFSVISRLINYIKNLF